MKVLGISGSLRAESFSGAIVRAAAKLAPDGMAFTIYEGLGSLPHFVPELEGEDAPEPVCEFYRLLSEADAVFISTPEYVFTMPGVLKNALEWTVATGNFEGKPVAAIGSSPSYAGGDKALASLVMVLQVIGAHIPEGASFPIPMIKRKIDAAGEIVDPAALKALRAALNALALQADPSFSSIPPQY